MLCVTVCSGDGGQVGSAALAGGGSRSRQSGAAEPAGGGEEVGGDGLSSRCFHVSYVRLAAAAQM